MDHDPQSRSQPTRHIILPNHRRELRVIALLGLLINRAVDFPHCMPISILHSRTCWLLPLAGEHVLYPRPTVNGRRSIPLSQQPYHHLTTRHPGHRTRPSQTSSQLYATWSTEPLTIMRAFTGRSILEYYNFHSSNWS